MRVGTPKRIVRRTDSREDIAEQRGNSEVLQTFCLNYSSEYGLLRVVRKFSKPRKEPHEAIRVKSASHSQRGRNSDCFCSTDWNFRSSGSVHLHSKHYSSFT